jgi:hypothetical protein
MCCPNLSVLKIGLDVEPETFCSRAAFDFPGLAEAWCNLLNRSLVARGISENRYRRRPQLRHRARTSSLWGISSRIENN